MEINIENSASSCCLKLIGEMTIYAASQVKDHLIMPINAAQEVDVDASGITDIDSAGMQLLILAKCHADQLGKPFQLSKPSRPVVEFINLFSLNEFFALPLSAHEKNNRVSNMGV